jgi:hypothetical protein
MNRNSGNSSFLASFQKNSLQKYSQLSSPSKVFILFLILLVVLFLFYILYMSYYNFSTFEKKQPYLIKDTISGTTTTIIQSKGIPQPHDGKYGMEWTYSAWMFIDNDHYKRTGSNSYNYTHVFHKGQGNYTQTPTKNNNTDINNMNIFCPLLELGNTNNELRLSVNTYPIDQSGGGTTFKQFKKITNIPVHKWFHLVIVCYDRSIDIYINGFLKEHWVLPNLPRWNFGNLYVAQDAGFIGMISRLRYFNYAIAPYQVEQLLLLGPSNKPCAQSNDLPPYLAKDYWFQTSNPTNNIILSS